MKVYFLLWLTDLKVNLTNFCLNNKKKKYFLPNNFFQSPDKTAMGEDDVRYTYNWTRVLTEWSVFIKKNLNFFFLFLFINHEIMFPVKTNSN